MTEVKISFRENDCVGAIVCCGSRLYNMLYSQVHTFPTQSSWLVYVTGQCLSLYFAVNVQLITD